MSYVGDINDRQVRQGMHNLIGAVIGGAIQPDNTYRLANGRMNRPEERGGWGKEWLASDTGKHWLKLAELTGAINPKTIIAIANDPKLDWRTGKPARDESMTA